MHRLEGLAAHVGKVTEVYSLAGDIASKMSKTAHVLGEEARSVLMSAIRQALMPGEAKQVFGEGTSTHGWGNQEEIMRCTRSFAIRKSTLFFLQLNEDVLKQALAIVPDSVRSKDGDTVESLAMRISESGFFDNLLVLQGGGQFGSIRVLLNSTSYAQPRRKSWSVVVMECVREGVPVRWMYSYGKANSRIRTEVTATPMPREIFHLGVQFFLSVRHVLSAACASTPPNHCQLLGYYGLFDSKMGRHKDNYELFTMQHMLHTFLRMQVDFDEQTFQEALNNTKGAMVPGADVLIYSVGPLPVLFSWCYSRKEAPFVKREMHEISPYMQIDLPHGSLFVFKAVDDLMFYHEINIDWRYAKPSEFRFAFVFRWLGPDQLSAFPIDPASETPALQSEGPAGSSSSGDTGAI